MIKKLKEIWKNEGGSYYHALSIPVLIGVFNGIWYWYDPANNWYGGGFSSEDELKKYLKEKYYCLQCNSWHVPSVWRVGKKGRRYNIQEISFVSWILS